MREQRDRLGFGVGTLPGVEQAVISHDFALRGGMERGKAFFDVRLHAAQRLGVLIGLFVTRNGSEADRFRQPRRGRLRVDRCTRYGHHLQLPRAMGDDVESQHGGHDHDRSDQKQQEVADDFDEPAHDVPGFSSSWPGLAV
jgi:hypothetical protein